MDRPTRKRSRRLVLAGLGALVVAAAVVVVLLLQPGPRPTAREVSAGHAVAAVSSDRMAALLLEKRLGSNELPSNVSALKPELASFRAYGLVAAVYIPLFGPASDLYLYYFVFDNSGDASSYYATYPPLPIHYTRTGHFVPGGITDSKKCDTGFEAATLGQAARWEASCESLSAKVVSFVVVASTTAGTSEDKRYSAALARDVIRHLLRVADAAPRASLTSPPGSLTPAKLLDRIYSSPVINDLLPPTITLSSLQKFNLGSNSPPGLVADTYLRATLASQSFKDSVLFYVFDTARSAQAFYKTATDTDWLLLHRKWVDRLLGILTAGKLRPVQRTCVLELTCVVHLRLCCLVGRRDRVQRGRSIFKQLPGRRYRRCDLGENGRDRAQ